MNPLVYIYTRGISLLAFSVRLCGLMGVLLVFPLAAYHLSGAWDLHYAATNPVPLHAFFRAARANPFVRFEDLVRQDTSLWKRCLSLENSPTFARQPVAIQATVAGTLWNWLASSQLWTYNPYPALRAIRVHEQRNLEYLLVCYYLSTQIGAVLVGAVVLCAWSVGQWRLSLSRVTASVGAQQLRDEDLEKTPTTLSVDQAGLFGVQFPLPLLRLAGQCAPARSILRILAAHQDWPASLDHHGAQPGGLMTHTTRAVTLALAHPGAHDPRLRTAFLLTVLAHDVGKVIAYEKHPAGRYVYRSYYHANKSADVLVAAGVYHAFSRDLAEAILIALRCSAGKALTPVPENTPAEAKTLLHWLTEVDHAAVEQDVDDLKQVVEHADYPALLAAVLAAPAPVVDLPPPLYTAGGSPYLIRDPARMVLVHLLGLEAHPGVHATVGRRDPVWDKLKIVLKETGASTGKEEKIEIPGITKPLSGVPLSGAFLKEHGV